MWLRVVDVPPEKAEGIRTAYGRDVAVLPADRVGEMIPDGRVRAAGPVPADRPHPRLVRPGGGEQRAVRSGRPLTG